MKNKALIAMSGGVDSSVAAHLMQQQGLDVIGVTLRLLPHDDPDNSLERPCCSLSDIEDARSVAFALNIPFYVFNFRDDFQQQVIDRFAQAYLAGQTPNPCIDCNRFIKFDLLLKRVDQLGFDYLVTGHYARIGYDRASGRYLLKKGVDADKDQSYVLYTMTQQQLARTLLPMGEFSKKETRAIAASLHLVNSSKPDSQDICFVKNGNYRDFLVKECGFSCTQGDFIDTHGNRLGTHQGTFSYTIGQRKGLGISAPNRLYVIDKDLSANTVTLGNPEDLYTTQCTVQDLNWISIPSLTQPMRVYAKTRYHHQESPATIFPHQNGHVVVEFDQPQRAITAGQAMVFYEDDIVIGGGTLF